MKIRGLLLRDGILGGILVAALGAALGALWTRFVSPSAWGTWAFPLDGGIYGYGIGAGLGVSAGYTRRGGTSFRLRAILGSLSGLFAIIFLSEPLHLDIFPPLMWGLLFLAPPLVATWILPRIPQDP